VCDTVCIEHEFSRQAYSHRQLPRSCRCHLDAEPISVVATEPNDRLRAVIIVPGVIVVPGVITILVVAMGLVTSMRFMTLFVMSRLVVLVVVIASLSMIPIPMVVVMLGRRFGRWLLCPHTR